MKNIRKKILKPGGFTMVELIAAMLLMSIVSVLWGIGIVQITDGFLTARQNAEAVHKVQMAMLRMVKEFEQMDTVSTAPSSSAITFSRPLDMPGITHILSLDSAGKRLEFDGETLADQVENLQLEYYEKYNDILPKPLTANPPGTWFDSISLIKIRLTMNVGGTLLEFTDEVFPRGLKGI